MTVADAVGLMISFGTFVLLLINLVIVLNNQNNKK